MEREFWKEGMNKEFTRRLELVEVSDFLQEFK
jgi:hypothetical protein